MARTVLHKYKNSTEDITEDIFSEHRGEVIVSYEDGNEGLFIKANDGIKRVGGNIPKIMFLTSTEYDELKKSGNIDDKTFYMVHDEDNIE